MKGLYIALGVILLLVLWGGCGYNGMNSSSKDVDQKWADVQSSYQRRSDLIPNLVATVKGVANFEKSTLVEVTNARARATSIQVDPTKVDPASLEKYQAAQGQLSQALGRLLVASERYPDLQSNQAFNNLMAELSGTENRIKVSRKDFSDAVQDYNTSVRTFPGVMFAKVFGFEIRPTFTADTAAQSAPTVGDMTIK